MPAFFSITNPLKAESIQECLLSCVDVILVFALPIIIFYIMYGGFLYVIARGNIEKIETAHKTLMWAIVGGVIVLGTHTIISIIQNTIEVL